MAVQPITRQALLNKMTNVIKNLPDDQLQQAWVQIDGWATPCVADGQVSLGQRVADEEEGLTLRQRSMRKPSTYACHSE